MCHARASLPYDCKLLIALNMRHAEQCRVKTNVREEKGWRTLGGEKKQSLQRRTLRETAITRFADVREKHDDNSSVI